MTAKELLEQHGLEKTFWGKKIIAAENRGWFAPQEVKEANGWQTCACGKQDPRIPREFDGAPKDRLLASLGGDFPDYLLFSDFLAAAETLIAIEKRAAEILAEIDK